MELWINKILVLFVLFTGSIFSGLLPLCIKRCTNKTGSADRSPIGQKIHHLVNCFAGGVFLSTTFLELIPEVRDIFLNLVAESKAIIHNFPLSEFLICIGLFIIVLCEHIVLGLKNSGNYNYFRWSSKQTTLDLDKFKDGGYQKLASEDDFKEQNETGFHISEAEVQTADDSATNQKYSQEDDFIPDIHNIRAFILLLALSVHTLFEGLAIGLKDNPNDLWSLFAAVFLHKIIITFSLSVKLFESCSRTKIAVLFICSFCAMTPIGVSIGTIISTTNQSSFALSITSCILQAIATGTFLHVTFFEILATELRHSHSLFGIFMVIVGFMCIALVTFFK